MAVPCIPNGHHTTVATRSETYFREKWSLKRWYHVRLMLKNLNRGTNKLKLDFKLFTENIVSTQQYPPRNRPLKSTLIWRKMTCNQVEDKTKFWAGTYYWTGPKFWAAGSKFWSAKSRVRLAGVTENAGRTCRKLSGIKRFFASRE